MRLHLVFHELRVVFPFSCQVFFHLIRRYPRLCVFAYEYLVFLGRVTNPSAKPPFLEDQFVCLSLASLWRPVRLGRSYQERKVPSGIDRKVVEASMAPPHTTTSSTQSWGEVYWCVVKNCTNVLYKVYWCVVKGVLMCCKKCSDVFIKSVLMCCKKCTVL